jgi:hypothetical protein
MRSVDLIQAREDKGQGMHDLGSNIERQVLGLETLYEMLDKED